MRLYQIAELLTEVLGRKITHRKLTVPDFEETYVTFGVSREHAKLLASTDGAVAKGFEESLFKNTPAERKYIGKQTLPDYIRNNRDLWLTQ